MFTLYPLCSEFLSWMGVEFCQILFMYLLRWSCGFLPLVCYFISLILHILNHHCEPGMNPTQLRCMTFFMYCWIQFADIFLRIFASIFIKDTDLIFFFWWCPCLVLVSGWWWLHRMSLGVFLLHQYFGRVWEGSV